MAGWKGAHSRSLPAQSTHPSRDHHRGMVVRRFQCWFRYWSLPCSSVFFLLVTSEWIISLLDDADILADGVARAAARAQARVERCGRGRRLRRRRRHRRRRLALRLVRESRDKLLLEHRLLLDRGPDLRDLVRLLLPRLGLSSGAVRCAFPSRAGGGASRVAPRGPRRRARETRWGRGGERACASLKSSFTASMWPRERTQKADDRKIF